MSAHLFGVKDITGVELNPIFIDLHTKRSVLRAVLQPASIPGLTLHVDDARSWFAGPANRST